MLKYLLFKIGYALLTLFGVITIIFFLFNVLPGDPARMMLDQNENSEQLAMVKKKYGFDKSIPTQYLYYLNDLSPISLHSTNPDDYTFLREKKYQAASVFSTQNYTLAFKAPYLRESFRKSGKNVSEIISNTLPNTFILAFVAIAIAIAVDR